MNEFANLPRVNRAARHAGLEASRTLTDLEELELLRETIADTHRSIARTLNRIRMRQYKRAAEECVAAKVRTAHALSVRSHFLFEEKPLRS